MGKLVPFDLIVRDQRVTTLYAERKLAREASHSLMRAVVRQLSLLTPKPLERGSLPPGVHVGKISDRDARRVRLETDGTVVIANTRTDSVALSSPQAGLRAHG